MHRMFTCLSCLLEVPEIFLAAIASASMEIGYFMKPLFFAWLFDWECGKVGGSYIEKKPMRIRFATMLQDI